MISLFNLETSIINAHGGLPPADLRQCFNKIRNLLKETWEDIRVFLQRTYEFGRDVVVLQDSLATQRPEDCLEFLKDMATTSDEFLKMLHDISARHIVIIQRFEYHELQFNRTLRGSTSLRPHVSDTLSWRGSQEFVDPRSGQRSLNRGKESIPSTPLPQSYWLSYVDRPIISQPSRVDRETRAWVGANLTAIRPDGLEALEDTSAAFASITRALLWFQVFWIYISKECHCPSVTLQHVAEIADQWKSDKKSVKNAVTRIARCSDAILVSAVGAPLEVILDIVLPR